MASLETDFNVGVIMLGAKNIRDAKRFFGFLCDNAQSLLALELECGGFLLQDSDNASTSTRATESDFTHQDVATTFDSVANGILRKFARGMKPKTSATLSAPAGVVGLLS